MYGSLTYNIYIRHVTHSPKGSLSTITYQLVGSTTSTNVTISGLTPNTSYPFDITATGPGGKSGYAGAGATTLSVPAPANLRVTGLTSTTITLAWDAPAVGELPVASYAIIGWYDGYAAQYPLGYANISNTTFTVTGIAPGTAFLWGVSARDTAGNYSAYDYLPSLVVNPVPTPAAVAAVAAPPSAAGGFQFAVQASAMQTTLIQATANLADPSSWVTIATNPPGKIFTFTDTDSGKFPTRYYRVVSP